MNDNTKIVEFVSFCVEMYAKQSETSGADVIMRFEQFGVLDYLFANYEALHTQGWGYIMSTIDDFIADQEAK